MNAVDDEESTAVTRIYRDKQDIDTQSVRSFFEKRAKAESNPVNAVMLQKEGSQIAIERDAYERSMLVPPVPAGSKVIELGCGAGRLACHYADLGAAYLGIDFSENLIAIATNEFKDREAVKFQVGEIPRVNPEAFLIQPPFDLVVITGLLIYLNDDGVEDTFRLIESISSKKAKIYLRESISVLDHRLTLNEFFSEELNERYSAVYRTVGEIKEFMEDSLVRNGFELRAEGTAFPKELQIRKETNQHFFLLER